MGFRSLFVGPFSLLGHLTYFKACFIRATVVSYSLSKNLYTYVSHLSMHRVPGYISVICLEVLFFLQNCIYHLLGLSICLFLSASLHPFLSHYLSATLSAHV